MRGWLLGLMLIVACQGKEDVAPECVSLCNELVISCKIDAYPSTASCEDGCMWDREQGLDVETEQECVEAAACDPFVIIACEREAESGS